MEDVLALVRAVLPEGVLVLAEAVSGAPADKGAYALLIRLDAAAEFMIGARGFAFAPGVYVYAGSARGPGGIRARLSRHFRKDKAAHWHVDRLTLRAGAVAALALPGGDECAIRARLAEAGFAPGPEGFGSSDCRRCPGHIVGAPYPDGQG